MEQKINIAEILKNCPTGMELDCTMYEDLYFDYVDVLNNIRCYIQQKFNKTSVVFHQDGTPNSYIKSKCVIFPKGKTTWEGFVPPCKFKDGDVLVHTQNGRFIMSIYKSNENEKLINTHVIFWDREEGLSVGMQICCYTDNVRFATKEEKAKLFDAIKDNGYKWNADTKTLEKLSEPKFKVGDRIKHKTYISQGAVVTEIKDTHYILDDESALPFTFQDEYDLVPNKFDITTLVPFESKVLVRNDKFSNWKPAIFGCYMKDGSDYYYSVLGGTCWIYCIPYESNEHLLGTTNDCDEFYKNWGELCHSKVKNCR